MIEIIGYLIGILGAIWAVSYILTFLWRSFKQNIDQGEIILATILAGFIRFFIDKDFSEILFISIAVLIVSWLRLNEFKKKKTAEEIKKMVQFEARVGILGIVIILILVVWYCLGR